MAAKDASFDVVSEVNIEEVKNAIAITTKELNNRFDFKDSLVEIKLENNDLVIVSDDDYKIEQIKDVLLSKLSKRDVPIRNIHFSETEKALGGNARQHGTLVSGIDKDNSKKIISEIKKSGIKVTAQINDEKIRVSGKSRDDLQKTIALLKTINLPIDLEFTNYR